MSAASDISYAVFRLLHFQVRASSGYCVFRLEHLQVRAFSGQSIIRIENSPLLNFRFLQKKIGSYIFGQKHFPVMPSSGSAKI
jgi:hypothetical protein